MKLALGRRAARRLAAASTAVCCTLLASGCGLLGSGAAIAPPDVMTISSGAFVEGVLPVTFTCGAAKPTTPPLSWAGAPPGTKSIALVVDDSSAPITPYVYWIVFNISPQTLDILEGQLPPGAEQARNSAGSTGYLPPCPGSARHTYRFTVYALNKPLNLPAGASLTSAWQAIAASAIPSGRGRTTASATS
ncbi:MAG TPA: YbhB/YbcL family Raf kinase inhibitor-like protein [Trebonia sp.]